jgi:hypothetical protein
MDSVRSCTTAIQFIPLLEALVCSISPNALSEEWFDHLAWWTSQLHTRPVTLSRLALLLYLFKDALCSPDGSSDKILCHHCAQGNKAHQILLCDAPSCDAAYHLSCLIPPLRRVPPGNWYCPDCRASQDRRQNQVVDTSNTDASGSSDEEEGDNGLLDDEEEEDDDNEEEEDDDPSTKNSAASAKRGRAAISTSGRPAKKQPQPRRSQRRAL